MKKLKVFKLSLKKWLRGDTRPLLYDPQRDKYCCLGMFGEQCGIPLSEMADRTSPATLALISSFKLPPDYSQLLDDNKHTTAGANHAMSINDELITTDAEKIKALRPIFRKWGYRIEVVE